jgi:hypothetical protein
MVAGELRDRDLDRWNQIRHCCRRHDKGGLRKLLEEVC